MDNSSGSHQYHQRVYSQNQAMGTKEPIQHLPFFSGSDLQVDPTMSSMATSKNHHQTTKHIHTHHQTHQSNQHQSQSHMLQYSNQDNNINNGMAHLKENSMNQNSSGHGSLGVDNCQPISARTRMSKLEAARQNRLQKKMQEQSSMSGFASSFKYVSGSHASTQQSVASLSSKEDQKLGDSHLMNQNNGCGDLDEEDASGSNLNLNVVAKKQIGANKKNAGGRASVHSQGLTHSNGDETLINTQRGNNVIQTKDEEAPVVVSHPYRRKTYQAPGGKVRTGRMTTSKTEMLINNGNTTNNENLSQTESNKTGENSRSIGADGKQRRRRGDRSKGETATTQGSSGQKATSAHFKKLFSKNVMLGRVKTPSTQATLAVTAQESTSSGGVQPAPTLNYDEQHNQHNLQMIQQQQQMLLTRHESVEVTVANSSKAVDFANRLLAKHEANMKKREKEGLYPPASPTPPSKTDNQHGQLLNQNQQHYQVVSSFINNNHQNIEEQLINQQFYRESTANYADDPCEGGEDLVDDEDCCAEGVEHFRSLQRVDELNESIENLNSARSQARRINNQIIGGGQQPQFPTSSNNVGLMRITDLGAPVASTAHEASTNSRQNKDQKTGEINEVQQRGRFMQQYPSTTGKTSETDQQEQSYTQSQYTVADGAQNNNIILNDQNHQQNTYQLDGHNTEVVENEDQNSRHNVRNIRRGNNEGAAFNDESLVDECSPIRQRADDDVDGTLMIDKNSSFLLNNQKPRNQMAQVITTTTKNNDYENQQNQQNYNQRLKESVDKDGMVEFQSSPSGRVQYQQNYHQNSESYQSNEQEMMMHQEGVVTTVTGVVGGMPQSSQTATPSKVQPNDRYADSSAPKSARIQPYQEDDYQNDGIQSSTSGNLIGSSQQDGSGQQMHQQRNVQVGDSQHSSEYVGKNTAIHHHPSVSNPADFTEVQNSLQLQQISKVHQQSTGTAANQMVTTLIDPVENQTNSQVLIDTPQLNSSITIAQGTITTTPNANNPITTPTNPLLNQQSTTSQKISAQPKNHHQSIQNNQNNQIVAPPFQTGEDLQPSFSEDHLLVMNNVANSINNTPNHTSTNNNNNNNINNEQQFHQSETTASQQTLVDNLIQQHQQYMQQQQQQQQQLQQDSHQNNMQQMAMMQQYECVFQQLNGQIQNLLLKIQQMENSALQQEIALYQAQQREQQLQNQLQQEKVQAEVKLAQVYEGNNSVQNAITQELEETKKTLIDLETQAKQMSVVIQQQNEKVAALEHNCALKEQQIQKLRQDNQNMFIDLKSLAQTDERGQRELIELRKQRNELEERNEQLVEQCQRQQAQIRSCYGENEQIKKEISSKSEQLPLMMQDMEQLQEENRLLIQKSQKAQQQLNTEKGEKEKSEKHARGIQAELSNANMIIDQLEQQVEDLKTQHREQQNQLRQQQQQAAANLSAANTHSRQKSQRAMAKSQSSICGPGEEQTSVAWPSLGGNGSSNANSATGENKKQMQRGGSGMQQQYSDDDLDHSPFRGNAKKSTIGSVSNRHVLQSQNSHHQDYSPLKGRQDPNMASYARQNAHLKQPQIKQLEKMTVSELMGHKQELEGEYQRLPITVSGKSMQVRKRKEELEFELDVVEKQIYRARQRGAM